MIGADAIFLVDAELWTQIAPAFYSLCADQYGMEIYL